MDKIVIEGGVPLNGNIEISGSKNAALPCLFATLLTDEECVLENVPDLMDIDTTCALLVYLGKRIERKGHRVHVFSSGRLRTEAPYDLVRKMRASALVLGPILARMGMAAASLPGGCAIGVRPINIHLDGFERLGAKTKLAGGIVRLSAKKLIGRKIHLAFPSVGATENLLMASVLAEGETVIDNAAREPEIVDCANFMIGMGADIIGAGSRSIRIRGKKILSGAKHSVIPDRIETATYMVAGVITRGELTVTKTFSEPVKSIINILKRAGVRVSVSRDPKHSSYETITCRAARQPIKPISVVTQPYPGFPTDVQAQWMTLMCLAKGKSVIQETVFENRFLHAAELSRMGAKIEIRDRRATVTGVSSLSGANVMVSDLRAGAAMVLAGLAAAGKTVVHRIYHLDRGYESLERKLRAVGAKIKRIS